MIGAHDITLIIRAQNQASAALSRVGRDVAKLSQVRQTRARIAATEIRLAQQQLQYDKQFSATGSRNLAMRQQEFTIRGRMLNLANRDRDLEVARAAIVQRANQLFAQEEAIKSRIVGLDSKELGIQSQMQRSALQISRTQQRIQSFQKDGIGYEQKLLAQRRAATNVMQAQLNLDRALARRRTTAAAGGDTGLDTKSIEVLRRRVAESEQASNIAQKSFRGLRQEVKNLQAEEAALSTRHRQITASMEGLSREATALETQLKLQADAWNRLSAQERSVQSREQAHVVQMQELNAALAKQRAELLELADAERIAAASMQQTNASLAEQKALLGTQQMDKYKNGAAAVAHAGRVMQMGGLLTTAAFGAAAAAAAHLNSSTTLAATQLENTAGAMVASGKKIQSAVVDTMQHGTSSAEDLSAAFYELFSGLNKQMNMTDATKTIDKMSDVAIAGFTNVKDATNLMITVLNNFGGGVQDIDKLINQQFVAVRYARIGFDEYAQSLNQIVPAFQGAGQSFQDMNAAFAQATRQLGPSFARSGLARLIEIFQRGEFREGMKQFGVNITDATGKLKPFDQIIAAIAQRFPQIAKGRQGFQEFVRMITRFGGAAAGQGGTLQAARVGQVLIQHAKEYNALTKEMASNTTQFRDQLAAVEQTTGIKWQEFINQLKALALIVGAAVIPVFIEFGKWIKPIVKFFADHPTITKWLGVVGAITGVVLLVVGSLATFGATIAGITIALGAMEGAAFTAGLAMAGLAGEFGLALAAGILLEAVINKLTGGRLNKAAGDLGGKVYDLFHPDPPDLHADQFQKQIAVIFREYSKFRSMGMDPKALQKTIMPADVKRLFPDIDEHAMKVFIHAAQMKFDRLVQAGPAGARGPVGVPQASTKGLFGDTGLYNNAQFLAAEKRAEQLRRAVERAPNMRAAMMAQVQYQNFVANMTKKMTKAQKDAQSAVESFLQGQPQLSDARFTKEYKNVQRLFQLASSSNAIAAWKRYYAAAEKLSADASQTQMQWAEKVFGQIEKQASLSDPQAGRMTSQLAGLQRQFNIAPTMQGAVAIAKLQKQLEALTPAQQMFFDKINENIKIFSDQEAVRAYAQVQRLKEAFDKAPSLAAWQAWFDANKSFTQQFTQDQQQAAQDIEAAHKAATDKIKEDYQSLLDKVRSTFDEIRTQNVSAFGQLGSGPVVTGLNNRVNQIKDAATRQSDAIRASGEKRAKALSDQADQIQKAFDASVSKISASQGNLIDWGLAANPEDQRAAVTSQVNALNEQAKRIKDASDATADRIEKNAADRADKLAKRLAAHKLTGGEIVADLQAQVKAFRNWNNDLNAIARRGAPSALVEQLRALGPEFDPMLKAIRGMSPAMFKKYLAVFNQGQKEIDKASLAATAARLKKEYPLYIQQGKNISEWLAQGVQENPALRNAFVKIMRSVFGTGGGPPAPTAPKGKAGQRKLQSGTHVTNNNTYNYHGGGMDYSTWMRKNHFKTRNQTRC